MPKQYKNPGRIEFEGKLNPGEVGGTFVNFPNDVEKLYGVKGRVPVNVTFDGTPTAARWSRWADPAISCSSSGRPSRSFVPGWLQNNPV
jgi:hypothetical protein